MLDEEHKKLLDTIEGADRLVKEESDKVCSPHNGGTTTVQSHSRVVCETTLSRGDTSSTSSDSNSDDEFLSFVRGIDYKAVFSNCGAALAIASVDGRFMDCNEEFLRITEYSSEELLGASRRFSSKQGLPSGGVVTVMTSTHTSSPSKLSGGGEAAVPIKTEPVLSPSPPLPVTQDENNSSLSDGNNRPPSEIHMRKQTLSLFNLLGREDMEIVYSAMSRMLRSPSSFPPSNSLASGENSDGKTDSEGTLSSSSMPPSPSSDSLMRSAEEECSGNEGSTEGGRIQTPIADHWSGNVKHTRRKPRMLQFNISLVRTSDGRPKFFNCALSEVE